MLEIGSIVDGKYKILNVVGKGGMSVVYLAMNERANKQWAIKEVRKDGVQNFEVVKQNLVVETDLLKRLNHPHLPSIIDVIDGEGTFLIVMDYIEGNPLSKALKTSGAQNQDDVIEWAKQLCDVLGYLHSRQPPIIYRDMKPSNVMLKPDGNVMLIDFGTAREFKSTSVADTTCLGTQGYAAPEQFGGQGQTDARTDIYCLGATMYHLVTGHNPAAPPYEMYPIRQWNPMLSSGLEEIITKCTQRNPNDRYQSCAELMYALEHYTDLDIENKKVQKTKWSVFVTSLILTVVMLFATLGFGFARNAQSASSYDSCISMARNAATQEEAAEDYKQAINLNPDAVEPYAGLLELYLDSVDNNYVLSKKEYLDYKDLINSNGSMLESAHPSEYAENVLYPLAQALFFSYEGGNSLNLAASKYKDVINFAKNQKIVAQSRLMVDMADYVKYDNATKFDGEASVTPSQYLKKLTEMCSSVLDTTNNAKLALMAYSFALDKLTSSKILISDSTLNPEKKQLCIDIQSYVSMMEKRNLVGLEENDELKESVLYKCQNGIQVEFK